MFTKLVLLKYQCIPVIGCASKACCRYDWRKMFFPLFLSKIPGNEPRFCLTKWLFESLIRNWIDCGCLTALTKLCCRRCSFFAHFFYKYNVQYFWYFARTCYVSGRVVTTVISFDLGLQGAISSNCFSCR